MTDAATVNNVGISTREEEATAIMQNNIYWAAGAGVIPVPLFDLVAITGIQLKMLNEFSKLYDIPFSQNRGKSIIASLIGSIGSLEVGKVLGYGLLKIIPGFGNVVSVITLPIIAGGFTYAVAKVFIQHFEAGGTFLDFNPESVKEYFGEQFEKGKAEASKAKPENKK